MKKSMFKIAFFILALGLLLWGAPTVQAEPITVGNDAQERSNLDTYYNFCIIDTNNPVSADGWLTVFSYYASYQAPFRFLLVDGNGVVKWVSEEITTSATGANVYTPDSAVEVKAGWNLGVYFASDSGGSIPFSGSGAPAYYTVNNSGLPEVGRSLKYEGSQNRTYSFAATGDTVWTAPPKAVSVTTVKYLDGKPASADSANNNYFLMTDFWDDPNIGEGASRFSLGPLGLNTDDPYQAVTATLTVGADYWIEEDTDQYAVDTTCDCGSAFRLDGYTIGDTLVEAEDATLTPPGPDPLDPEPLNLIDIDTNKVIILWNSTCPQTETIVAGNDTNGDPKVRPMVDAYGDFLIVDTNHPVSGNGWLTAFHYYAANPYPFRFTLVDENNVVQWVSDEITPNATGVHTFTPTSPVPVQKGWNVGLYFASTGKNINGTIPYEYTGAPAYYRSNNSGSPLPEIGQTIVYEGSSNRIYSFAATGITVAPVPETVSVTVVKYLDGIRADAVSADNAEFPMRAFTGDVEETFVLGPVGVNSLNLYEATFDMALGASYSVWEDTTSQETVGARCNTGQRYCLVGYTIGDTLVEAVNAKLTSKAPNMSKIDTDKFIIVWNKPCGTDDDSEHNDNGHHYGNDKPDNHESPRDNGHHYGNDKPDNHESPQDNGHHYGNDKPDNHESPNNSQGKKK